MKQECLTYLNTIGKSIALAATLSDIKPEDDLDDNDDEGILNAFTTTTNLLRGLLKMWMKKRTWWNLTLRKWMNKMTSMLPMLSCTRFQRNMRKCIGWPPKS